jgi:hypothetical protein
MQTVTLEPSTNTHRLTSTKVSVTDLGHGILRVEVPAGHAVVTHGEHGTLATESCHIMKYVQQEYNPVTQKMQAAFD